MKPVLLILIFLQVSLYAQTERTATPFTTLNGKTLDIDKMMTEKSHESKPDFSLSKKEISEATVTLQPYKAGDAVPAIKSLEVYIPGYPAILIDGNKFDMATIEKVNNTKAGNVMVVSPHVESGRRPSVMTIEIMD